VRSAATLLLIVLTATLTGAVLVLFVDGNVNLTEALFLSTSAATNGGMSIGTLGTFSPVLLKVTVLLLMLLGRLEWLAVFATVGFLFAGIRGRR
jgi:Trk-type K+ transport system membrane component